jgi:hypothetical protein
MGSTDTPQIAMGCLSIRLKQKASGPVARAARPDKVGLDWKSSQSQ